MLVLTRRVGESIIIGNGIKLTVVNVGPGRVKIGILAPPSVRVDREEVHERIAQENHEKASDVLDALSALGGGADPATLVGSGAETGILNSGEGQPDAHATASEPATSPTPPPAPAPAPTPRLSQFKPPRKPR